MVNMKRYARGINNILCLHNDSTGLIETHSQRATLKCVIEELDQAKHSTIPSEFSSFCQ